ncbi:MAG: host-nuclease inhibitor Gam family protein [Alphaproteobacteria bacterium]|nr:host-nuclease inhibitor Gam family protein [Alphaproteobacteria bacterium]
MARRMKTPAAPAITSLDELTARVGRWATVQAQIETLQAQAGQEITAIKIRLGEALAPLEAELKAILLAAKPWWEANSEQLTDGKKKSALLAGCQIGIRLSPPALAFPKPAEHAVNLIEGQGWKTLLRVTTELDKLAILKALAFVPPEAASEAEIDGIVEALDLRDGLRRFGFDIAQKEEFFIARAAEPAPPTETVETPAEQVAG